MRVTKDVIWLAGGRAWFLVSLLYAVCVLSPSLGADPGVPDPKPPTATAPDSNVQPRTRGRLLKVPKVYNALVTSNEPLLPSRAEQASVGQVLYYPPHPHHHHHGYPAASGPLILPQVAAQHPPLYDPSLGQHQPLVSLPPLQHQQDLEQGPALQVNLQGATAHEHEQETPWPVVYASDAQQQQQHHQQQQHQQQLQQYYPAGLEPVDPSSQSAPFPAQPSSQSAPFPAARAIQTVERLAAPGRYQAPASVDIDSIKNNRPSGQGIHDVPPPPLPVGRGRPPPMGPPPLPPGILPF